MFFQTKVNVVCIENGEVKKKTRIYESKRPNKLYKASFFVVLLLHLMRSMRNRHSFSSLSFLRLSAGKAGYLNSTGLGHPPGTFK